MYPYYEKMSQKIKEALSNETDLEKQIKKTFKRRGLKAIKLARNNGIKKVYTIDGKELWIAEGHRGRYLIIPMYYCSCNGFTTLIASGENEPCYHLIAQAYAQLKNIYSEEHTNKTYDELLIELLEISTKRNKS
ncbi:MAG: hypothetical protein ACP5IZ_02255 [Thermoprotei archaeon]|jgi:predicted nucleic acid-binding Zn finger protein